MIEEEQPPSPQPEPQPQCQPQPVSGRALSGATTTCFCLWA